VKEKKRGTKIHRDTVVDRNVQRLNSEL